MSPWWGLETGEGGRKAGGGQVPLTGTSTDCMARSHGGFRARGRVAYQKVVSAANAPKPMSVLVGRVRTYCRKSTSSGSRKYRNSSWACIVLGWQRSKPQSVGEKKVMFIPGRREAVPNSPRPTTINSIVGASMGTVEPQADGSGHLLLAVKSHFSKSTLGIHFTSVGLCKVLIIHIQKI